MECLEGFRGRFEIADAMALGDVDGCPAPAVGLVTEIGAGAVAGEPVDGAWEVLVGGAVHGGFPIVVDMIQVGAVVEKPLEGFEDLRFGSGLLGGGEGSQPGGGHEGGGLVVVGDAGMGAQFEEPLQVGEIGRGGGEEERGGAAPGQEAFPRAAGLELEVYVGAVFDEFSREVEGRHRA